MKLKIKNCEEAGVLLCALYGYSESTPNNISNVMYLMNELVAQTCIIDIVDKLSVLAEDIKRNEEIEIDLSKDEETFLKELFNYSSKAYKASEKKDIDKEMLKIIVKFKERLAG